MKATWLRAVWFMPVLALPLSSCTSDPAPVSVTQTQASTIVVTTADATSGITGYAVERASGTRIDFDSRVSDGAVVAAIYNATDAVFQYDERATLTDAAASPALKVAGQAFTAFPTSAVHALAGSPAGRLIQDLGMHLIEAVPGEDFTDERRGIELAFQAVQTEFPTAVQTLRNADIYYGPDGFLVRTQPKTLLLNYNFLSEIPEGTAFSQSGESESGDVAYDGYQDASNANHDCKGRCGPGCGTFTGTWIGNPAQSSSALYCVGNTTDYNLTQSGQMHFTTGPVCSSDECYVHDGCSSNWFAELTYCNVLDPTLIGHMCDYYLTWTYDGPETMVTQLKSTKGCNVGGMCCGATHCVAGGAGYCANGYGN